MERDDEVKGSGNSLDFGARIYDSRLGRFLSLDRFTNNHPYKSGYTFAANRPIWAIDYNGDVDFIVNHVSYNTDGKVYNSFQSKFSVTTGEDIIGIQRSPVIINVINKDVYAEITPGIKQVITNQTVTVDKKSGETKGEELKRTDPLQYYLAKAMINNPFGTGRFSVAAIGEDPFTGAKLGTKEKITEIMGGIVNLASMGRAAYTGKMTSLFSSWVVDYFVEQNVANVWSKIEDKFGVNKSQQTILLYYGAKFINDARKGDLNKLTDYLIKSASLGVKGKKFVDGLKSEQGIDLDMPLNSKEATEDMVNNLK